MKSKKKNKIVLFVVVAIVIVIGCFFFWRSGGIFNKQGSQVSSLTSFVDAAAEHLTADGDKALADFRDPTGAWIKGNNYIFVYDMAGNTVVLPPQADLEGTNRMETADPNGERYVQTMVKILQVKPYGWNVYQYAKPGDQDVSTKLSYFKRVEGWNKTYVIGSGIYLDK